MEIEVLSRQGKGIRAIARELSISRNTVRTILRGAGDQTYGPRQPRPTKLGPFHDYLRERISAAGATRLTGIVLLREIRELGYVGGVSQLKLFLATIRPAKPLEPIVRFETASGDQPQIDFVVFRRGEFPLRAFTASLGYSRMSYVAFVDNERFRGPVAIRVKFYAALRRWNQTLPIISSANQRKSRAFPSILARFVLSAACNTPGFRSR